MPKILTVELTSEQQAEVRRRLARRDLSRSERRRLECIRLLVRGLSAPQVADLVECNPVTVRDAVHRFTGGFEALADAPRLGRPAQVTDDDLKAVGVLLDAAAAAGVTWSAPQLCDWLDTERGVRVSAAWLTELLQSEGFRWKRTRDSLRHKADPVLQQAARARLEDLRTYGWRPTRARAI